MSAAAVAKRLADAGLDASAIVAALEAFEAVEEDRKSKARERKRRQRAKEGVTERDVTGQGVTDRDPPTPSLSPQTPLTHPHPRVDITTHVRDGGFDRFWAAYPLKKSKPQAAKAYAKAIRRTDLDTILAAIEAQRVWPQWTDGFVPHAATWLNNDRWADEPDLIRKNRTHDHQRPSPKSEHLERVARAMAASVGGSEGERPDDCQQPDVAGGSVPRLTVVGGSG